jgi:hypothetical protein
VEFDRNNLTEEEGLIEYTQLFWLASAMRLAALFLGGFIVYLAYRGYKRNVSKPLLYVALGFALITLGTLLEGVMFVIMGSDILAAIAAEGVLTVTGFLAILYSIYSVK